MCGRWAIFIYLLLHQQILILNLTAELKGNKFAWEPSRWYQNEVTGQSAVLLIFMKMSTTCWAKLELVHRRYMTSPTMFCELWIFFHARLSLVVPFQTFKKLLHGTATCFPLMSIYQPLCCFLLIHLHWTPISVLAAVTLDQKVTEQNNI